jgi:ATP-dependent DNA helicase RecQ
LDIYRQILKQYWGYDSFRPLQEDIVKSVAAGNDCLGLMPTGGGKSITFQVPALSKPGICIVVTPLIALMKDQVDNLRKRGIRAMAIYSGMFRDEIDLAFENCINGDYKFLYVSPERLGTELFLARLKRMSVNLIAVDEAHCISQWGYDFRPSYLKISDLRTYLPAVPVLALTATAIPIVAEDIMDQLRFRSRNVFRMSFERKNLRYHVRETEDKQGALLKFVSYLKGSGIVYVRNRKKTRELSEYLTRNKLSADYYHAGLKHEIRTQKQKEWTAGKTRVILATNAFGMGIDKPDVRFVIHYDLPDSLEAYFQEAGRAGRDFRNSFAILLWNQADKINMKRRVESQFPGIEIIKKTYHALGNFLRIPYHEGKGSMYDFNLGLFARHYRFNIMQTFHGLKTLQSEGYIEFIDELDQQSKVHILVSRDVLYKFQIANAQFDPFIKLLLRTYAGLFSGFVAVDERHLAQLASVDAKAISEYLNKLNNLKVLRYIPRKNNPVIVFSTERMDEKSLFINQRAYSLKKERYIERLQGVFDYAARQAGCRSRMLLTYFGEKDPPACGTCDLCTRKNDLDITQYEFDKMVERIQEAVSREKILLNQLTEHGEGNEAKTLRVIRWLLDHNMLVLAEDNSLKWKK